MSAPLDVLVQGEALVDLLPDRRGPLRRVGSFAVHAGGAPANVAVGLARLGARVALLGLVGEDEFGAFLHDALAAEGVDVSGLQRTRAGKTGLSFVELDEQGERRFFGYGAPTADAFFGPEHLDEALVRRARIVHVGSNGLVSEAGVAATTALLAQARAAGAVISVDPNVRLHLWRDVALLRPRLQPVLAAASLAKLSLEEADFWLGAAPAEEQARRLVHEGLPLAIVTAGDAGAVWARRDGAMGRVAAPRVAVVDSTGAGDGFVAGLLAALAPALPPGVTPAELSVEALHAAIVQGCRVGAAVVGKLGATAGLPRAGEPLPG